MASQKENQKAAKSGRVIRPSPNEEQAILKNAVAERRKQRLLQVRKQEKKLAGKILTAVRTKREKEMAILKMQLKDEWEKKISAELEELEVEYCNRIKTLGEGHRSVHELPDTDTSTFQQEMTERALQRYKDALKKLTVQRAALKKIEEEKSKLRARVAQEEQGRAAQIASKPHREPDFILKSQNQNRCSTLSSRSKTVDTFSTTRYHMATVFAEKAEQLPEIDAREAAKGLEERITEARELLEKDLNERNEKAHLRHQHARQQVLLDQSKDRLIVQLEELEYRDRVRRQQVLAKIPKQVFQPPYQRLADAKSKQIILEEAFESAHRIDRDSREKDLHLDLGSDLNMAEPYLSEKGDARRDLPQRTMLNDEDMNDVQRPFSEADTRRIAIERDDTPEREKVSAQQEPAQDLAKRDQVGQPKRMQELLGRIRKQQDEWSKINAPRKLIGSAAMADETHPSPVQTEGQREIEPVAVTSHGNESTDSLVSADIESARYTNSNTDIADTRKDTSSPDQPNGLEAANDIPKTPDQISLLHPIEKGRLIRSAKRTDSSHGSEAGSLNLDTNSMFGVDKHKKTLENQKYLLKIQKQRLENEMLKQDLRETEKELEKMVEIENEKMAEGQGDIEKETENMIDVGTKLDIVLTETESEKEFVLRIENQEEDRLKDVQSQERVVRLTTDLSFISEMSEGQRNALATRYPNIFQGFSLYESADSTTSEPTLNRNKEREKCACAKSEVVLHDRSEPNIPEHDRSEPNIPEHDRSEPNIPKYSNEEKLRNKQKERFETAKSSVVKPKVELERIRKYQEQLLQKQKWLNSRQEIMQERQETKLKELAGEKNKQQGDERDEVIINLKRTEGGSNKDLDSSDRTARTEGLSRKENLQPDPLSTRVSLHSLPDHHPRRHVDTARPSRAMDQTHLDRPIRAMDQAHLERPNGAMNQTHLHIDHDLSLQRRGDIDIDSSLHQFVDMLSNSRTFAERQGVYEQQVENGKEKRENFPDLFRNRGDRDSVRQTNDLSELLPHLEGIPAHDRDKEMSEGQSGAEADTESIGESTFAKPWLSRYGLQNLLDEVESLHAQAAGEVDTSKSLEPQNAVARKASRVISGKPAFSPIQEVEESSFKEKRKMLSPKRIEGSATTSSLAEQELPSSARSLSQKENVSPKGSAVLPTDKTDTSSMFSFRELLPNLSDTEFLSLPPGQKKSPIAPVSSRNTATTTQSLPYHRSNNAGLAESTRQTGKHSVETDNWIQLLPDFSATLHGNTGVNADISAFIRHPLASANQDSFKLPDDVSKSVQNDGNLAFDREKYSRIVQKHIPFATLPLEIHSGDPVKDDSKGSREIQETSNFEATKSDKQNDAPVVSTKPRIDTLPLSTASRFLRETFPIHLEDSTSSSNRSKSTSTNMSRYEEILERVRMLPYKHLEEYNRLAESWRKETVEPLLNPDIPDPFQGYEAYTDRERKVDSIARATMGRESGKLPRTEIASYQNEAGHGFARSQTVQTRNIAGQSRNEDSPAIVLHEPIRSFEFPNDMARQGDAYHKSSFHYEYESSPRQTGQIDDDTQANVDALHRSRVHSLDNSVFHKTREQSLRLEDDDILERIPGAFQVDELREQKLFDDINEKKSDSDDGVKQGNEEAGEDYHYGGAHATQIPDRSETFVTDTAKIAADIDISNLEQIQRCFLEEYVSSFGNSPKTKSSSSSRQAKSFLSSDFRSDETVSELARLWPLSAQSIRPGQEENRISDTKEGDSLNTMQSSVAGMKGTESKTEPSSIYSDIKTGLTVDSSSGFKDPNNYETSKLVQPSSLDSDSRTSTTENSDFKDPNHYEISLFRTQDGYQTRSKSASSSHKEDSDSQTLSLPSFPRFASTRLAGATSPSLSESSFRSQGKGGLDESLQSSSYLDGDHGHAETSWLVQVDKIKSSMEESDSEYDQERQSGDRSGDSSSWHTMDTQGSREIQNEHGNFRFSSGNESSSHVPTASVLTWNEILATQLSASSTKESDSEIPEVVHLKKEAFIKKSQQRVEQIKRKDKDATDKKTVRYRPDGRFQRIEKKDGGKENNRSGITAEKKRGVSQAVQTGKERTTQTTSHKSTKKPTKQEILLENRKRAKQFQKKVQSSLRSRRK